MKDVEISNMAGELMLQEAKVEMLKKQISEKDLAESRRRCANSKPGAVCQNKPLRFHIFCEHCRTSLGGYKFNRIPHAQNPPRIRQGGLTLTARRMQGALF